MGGGGTSLNSGSESGGGHKHIFAPHSEKCPPCPPGSYASAEYIQSMNTKFLSVAIFKGRLLLIVVW